MEETKIKERSHNLLNIMAVNMADLGGSMAKLRWLHREYKTRLDELDTDYKINSTALKLAIESIEGAIDIVSDEIEDN